ncbi:MAG: endonuclease/exonuclease/phosphatase family protein [Segniliparus sp.]|uniref:endonuclease/exonuclease/phosphatase family protein n=1 Tax=Segniliparus sp. TaxID=2804064 RepID=UPI003F3DF129
MRARRVVGRSGLVLLLALVAGFFARETTWDWAPSVMIAMLWPAWLLSGVFGVALVAFARWRRTAAVGLVLVVATASFELPLFRGGASAGASAGRLTVAQGNLFWGTADPKKLLDVVRTRQVDVLAVEEVTPHELDALRSAGFADALPYSFTLPGLVRVGDSQLSTPCDTVLFSRYPLTGSAELTGPGGWNFLHHPLRAAAQTPWGPVTVVAAHVMVPWPAYMTNPGYARNPAWGFEIRPFREALAALPSGDRVVVAGDFNATYDVADYRAILAEGFADAGIQAGAGFVPTWEQGTLWQLLAADHVLARNATATRFESFPLVGSDHAGVIATVQF